MVLPCLYRWGQGATAGHLIQATLVLSLSSLAGIQLQAEDVVLRQAVAEALAAERPDQVLRLLADIPSDPVLRQWLAQAQAMVNNPAQALATLGVQEGDYNFKMSEELLGQWPLLQRGSLAALIGDCAHLQGRGDALIWWSLAIDYGGPEVDRNRLLLALAEEAARQENWQIVQSSAQTLWQRRGDWQQRLRGGELLALALLREDRAAAVQQLVTLLAHPQLQPPQQRRLAIYLGQAAWMEQPALVLRVIREAQQFPSADGDAEAAAGDSALSRWQALALAQLDSVGGLAALEALPPSEQSIPLVREQIQGLREQQIDRGSIVERRNTAAAALAMNEVERAEKILQSLYFTDGMSLRLWLSIPDRNLTELLGAPSSRSLEGGFALVQALAMAGDRAAAWRVLRPLLQASGPSPSAEVDRLSWALALSTDQAPTQRLGFLRQLREYKLVHAAVGQAWAEYALSLSQADAASAVASEDVSQAWQQALRHMPPTAPWAALVAGQVLQQGLTAAEPWQPAAQPNALLLDHLDALQSIALASDDAEHQALQWLIAQALVHVGRRDQARTILHDLSQRVSPARQGRIAEVLQRMDQP